MSYIPRLQTQYAEEIAPALMKQFEYKSAMQVPRIQKICLNQGLGKAVADRKVRHEIRHLQSPYTLARYPVV